MAPRAGTAVRGARRRSAGDGIRAPVRAEYAKELPPVGIPGRGLRSGRATSLVPGPAPGGAGKVGPG